MTPDLVEALIYYLGTRDAVTARAGGRLFKDSLPASLKSDRPALVVTEISGAGGQTQTGADGLVQARVQIDCIARLDSDACQLREAVRESLDGMGNAAIGQPGQTVTVEMAAVENRRKTTYPPTEGGEPAQHWRSFDVMIWHRESIPAL